MIEISNSEILVLSKYFLLFVLCATFFPLILVSNSNLNLFQFLNVPIFSLSCGFLFQSMIQSHYYLYYNDIQIYKNRAFISIYYILLYVSGYFWASLFIIKEKIVINKFGFLLLPIVNCLIFLIVFSLSYFRLVFAKIPIQKMFYFQVSGLNNINLEVKQELRLFQSQDVQIKQQSKLQITPLNTKADIQQNSDSSQNEDIKFIKLQFFIALIFIFSNLQIIFSLNVFDFFQSLLDKDKRLVWIVCSLYPIFIGLIKAFPGIINSVTKINYFWQIQFISLFFASLPYRIVYFEFNNYVEGFGIIVIKIVYKTIVYYLQSKYNNEIFLLQLKINSKLNKKKNKAKVEDEKQSPKFQGSIDLNKNKNINDNALISDTNSLNKIGNSFQNNLRLKQISIPAKQEPQLEQIIQKSQFQYTLLQNFELLQFSDILHSIGVMFTLLINSTINKDKNINFLCKIEGQLAQIFVLFIVELALDFVQTALICYFIGLSEVYKGFNFRMFLFDILLYFRQQFFFILTAILCSYSIVFIYLNNQELN